MEDVATSGTILADPQHCPYCGHPLASHLSDRELDVLRLVGEGYSDKRIARKLGIAYDTVHNHMRLIFAKLEVPNRTAAVVRALRLGLLPLTDNG